MKRTSQTHLLALVLAVLIAAPCSAQKLQPELLAPPADIKPRHATFSLGTVAGLPIFALVQRTGTETPSACGAYRLLVQANKGADVDSGMQQAVIAYLKLCDNKVLAGKQPQDQPPRLRSGLAVDQYDAAGVQRTLGEDRGNPLYTKNFLFEELPGGAAVVERDAIAAKQNADALAAIAALQPALQANEARLKALFSKHRISAFAALSDIARNPFTYEQQFVLTVATFDRAISASEIALSTPARRGGYFGESSSALHLQNASARDWREGSYLVVMQVQGRNSTGSASHAIANAVTQIACTQYDCRDMLSTPDATGTMVQLFRFGMRY